jgi:hypothetical protein
MWGKDGVLLALFLQSIKSDKELVPLLTPRVYFVLGILSLEFSALFSHMKNVQS